MSKNKKILHQQRERIDFLLKPLIPVLPDKVTAPRLGWIKTIRQNLGLSTLKLAERLGIERSVVSRMEKRESQKRVTLETLEKAAQAMECQLIYFIVPQNESSFENLLDRKSLEAAKKLFQRVNHSAELENQAVKSKEYEEKQLRKLARELKEKLSPLIWK